MNGKKSKIFFIFLLVAAFAAGGLLFGRPKETPPPAKRCPVQPRRRFPCPRPSSHICKIRFYTAISTTKIKSLSFILPICNRFTLLLFCRRLNKSNKIPFSPKNTPFSRAVPKFPCRKREKPPPTADLQTSADSFASSTPPAGKSSTSPASAKRTPANSDTFLTPLNNGKSLTAHKRQTILIKQPLYIQRRKKWENATIRTASAKTANAATTVSAAKTAAKKIPDIAAAAKTNKTPARIHVKSPVKRGFYHIPNFRPQNTRRQIFPFPPFSNCR